LHNFVTPGKNMTKQVPPVPPKNAATPHPLAPYERLKFTEHGFQRAVLGSRGDGGVKHTAMRHTLKNPTARQVQSSGRIRYEGVRSTVVMTAQGEIHTAWAHGKKWRRLF